MRQLNLLASNLRRGLHRMAYETCRRFPYGMWSTRGGREIIFDRAYHPLWQRQHGGPWRAADPYEWVEHIVHTEFFFPDDSRPPYQQYVEMKRLRALLLGWDRRVSRNRAAQ
jgi:hypothetical protein